MTGYDRKKLTLAPVRARAALRVEVDLTVGERGCPTKSST